MRRRGLVEAPRPRRGRIGAIARNIAIAGLLALGPAGTARAVTVEGPYSYWGWPSTDFYNVDQRVTVLGHDPGIKRFWATSWWFVGGDAGYMGLQVGAFPNNNKIALFSIFRANGHSGANCSAGSEVGIPFHSCRIDPYAWVVGREYRFRVWALSADAQGTWYGAWVLDTVSGIESKIGELRVPTSWDGITGDYAGVVSWTERFNAAPAACSGIGWSRARWRFPTANNGTVKVSARNQVVSDGDCPAWTRVLHAAGADIQEMGKSSTETSWCGNLAPTGFGPIARCTKTDPSSLFYGNFSPLTGGFTHIAGPLTAQDRRQHEGWYPAADGSGTFYFYGGPMVSTIFGPASYGEQRWANPVFGPLLRYGTVNFITSQFYPDGGWLQDVGP